jgi:hypothetical protein
MRTLYSRQRAHYMKLIQTLQVGFLREQGLFTSTSTNDLKTPHRVVPVSVNSPLYQTNCSSHETTGNYESNVEYSTLQGNATSSASSFGWRSAYGRLCENGPRRQWQTKILCNQGLNNDLK